MSGSSCRQSTTDVTPTLKLVKLDPSAVLPARATEGSAALDLTTTHGSLIQPNEIVRFQTGIAIELPALHCALVLSRSGLATKHGIVVTNQPGLIDPDYRGEVLVSLHNVSNYRHMIAAGDRIAQLLVVETPLLGIEVVETLTETVRGKGGFGHSGA